MYSDLTVVATTRTGLVFEIQKAVDPSTNKVYAIKMMRETAVGTPKYMNMIKAEWSAVRGLDHRNVIRYYHFGREGKRPYIVMEWIDAENLKSYVEKNFPGGLAAVDKKRMFETRTAVEDIIVQIIEAIGFVHNHGTIHLDIKPENFLYMADKTIKLIDFSNSRTGFWARMRKNTSIDGSPSFISPEQIRKERPDESSDIYSLGATIYYLLSGSPPFTGASVDRILTKHITERPVPLMKNVPSIRKEFSSQIDLMLEKKKADRLRNLSMLKKDILTNGIFPKLR